MKPPEPPIDPTTGEPLLGKEFRKARQRYLVRRSHVMTIVAAWIVTVAAAAAMAGLFALGLLSSGVIRMP